MGVLRTDVRVDFSEDAFFDSGQATNAGDGIVLESASRPPDATNVKFFRVHGADLNTSIITSSGAIRIEQRDIYKFSSEFVNFRGSRVSALRYPDAINVDIKISGRFYGEDGQIISTPIRFDAAKNSLVANVPIYGVVLCEYDAPYDLYKAIFAGRCPSVQSGSINEVSLNGGTDDDEPYEGLDPMIILAVKSGLEGTRVVAELPLSAPECEYPNEDGYGYQQIFRSGGRIATLKLEVDPDNPIQYRPNEIASNLLDAGCTLRVFPDAESITATYGVVRKISTAAKFKEVTEVITYQGTSSNTLSYKPRNGIAPSITANFVDRFGRSFKPDFKTAGENVTVVNWVSRGSYNTPRSRVVADDEIVLTTFGGKAIEAYGSVTVTYVAEYREFDFAFLYDSTAGEFKTDSIVATLGGQNSSAVLNPPRDNGVL